MPVQFPVLTKDQQNQMLMDMRLHTLYPYSYHISALVTVGVNFNAVDTGGLGGRYLHYIFQAPMALSLEGIELTAILNPVITEYFGFIISYNSGQGITMGAANVSTATSTTPTPPDDSGNDIVRIMFLGNAAFHTYINLQPYNYYLAKGQQLSLWTFADAAALAAASSTMVGQIVLHTRSTGLQV